MKVGGLIFIYNAQSGVFHSLIDNYHRVLSPFTYERSLCSLTYNNYGRLRVWKQFIQSLNIPVIFKYTDHLSEIVMDKQTKLPFVINTDLFLVASAEEINQCKTISALIKLIRKKYK